MNPNPLSWCQRNFYEGMNEQVLCKIKMKHSQKLIVIMIPLTTTLKINIWFLTFCC